MSKTFMMAVALATVSTVVGCGDDRTPGGDIDAGAGGVGAVCTSVSDCSAGLQCNAGYLTGQCTISCGSDGVCNDFSPFSYCIGAMLCVAECARDEDCPPRTSCNSSGWCKR